MGEIVFSIFITLVKKNIEQNRYHRFERDFGSGSFFRFRLFDKIRSLSKSRSEYMYIPWSLYILNGEGSRGIGLWRYPSLI